MEKRGETWWADNYACLSYVCLAMFPLSFSYFQAKLNFRQYNYLLICYNSCDMIKILGGAYSMRKIIVRVQGPLLVQPYSNNLMAYPQGLSEQFVGILPHFDLPVPETFAVATKPMYDYMLQNGFEKCFEQMNKWMVNGLYIYVKPGQDQNKKMLNEYPQDQVLDVYASTAATAYKNALILNKLCENDSLWETLVEKDSQWFIDFLIRFYKYRHAQQ